MTDYVCMMDTMLDHIEQHLDQRLSVDDLAARCGYSPFHFARMFRACVGTSIKQYVLGRKLERARQLLQESGRVIDVALELGFDSPEVFSRAFRRAYGVPPSRTGDVASPAGNQRVRVVERHMSNWRGTLLPDAQMQVRPGLFLRGVHATVDVTQPDWGSKMQGEVRGFVETDATGLGLDPDRLFIVVHCHGASDEAQFDIFHGRQVHSAGAVQAGLASFEIAAGRWAAFSYRGDLLAIRGTLEDDFYRWMAARGLAPPAHTNVGMLIELGPDYPTTQTALLRIPLTGES